VTLNHNYSKVGWLYERENFWIYHSFVGNLMIGGLF
jgi:hypothetical protein